MSGSELEALGKRASRLAETSGLSLTEAAIRTLEHEGLNAEQVRRAVEHANINAVNAKFAQLRGDRIVHIDGGPADPTSVIEALHSSSYTGAKLAALEYSAPPRYETERQPLPLASGSALQELRDLHQKLSAAHEELIELCNATEMRFEEKLSTLKSAALRASREGASLVDLATSWSYVDPQMAKLAARKLGTDIPWGEKRAGLRVAQDHSAVRSFVDFAKTASEFFAPSRPAVRWSRSLGGSPSSWHTRPPDTLSPWRAQMDGRRLVRSLAKTAAKEDLAVSVGRAIASLVRGGGRVLNAGGNVGAGVAKGLGASRGGQELGRLGGKAGVLYGGVEAGGAAKRRFDMWRYEHGLAVPPMYM